MSQRHAPASLIHPRLLLRQAHLYEELGIARLRLGSGDAPDLQASVREVTGTLIVRGADRADGVAQAMRCRGFDGRFRSLTTFRTRLADVVMFILIVGVAGGLVAWDVWG